MCTCASIKNVPVLTDALIRAMETAETSATGRILIAYKIITALSIKDQQAMI